MTESKNKLILYLGLALPVLMIILVWLSVYLPGVLIKSQYNFLYLN